MNNIKWDEHERLLLEMHKSLYERQEDCDVTLVANGTSVRAHRFILSKCSDLLRAVLSDVPLGQRATIIIPEIDGSLLESVMSFVYLGETSQTSTKMSEFVKVINVLRINASFETSAAPLPVQSCEMPWQTNRELEVNQEDQNLISDQHFESDMEFPNVYDEASFNQNIAIENVKGYTNSETFMLPNNATAKKDVPLRETRKESFINKELTDKSDKIDNGCSIRKSAIKVLPTRNSANTEKLVKVADDNVQIIKENSKKDVSLTATETSSNKKIINKKSNEKSATIIQTFTIKDSTQKSLSQTKLQDNVNNEFPIRKSAIKFFPVRKSANMDSSGRKNELPIRISAIEYGVGLPKNVNDSIKMAIHDVRHKGLSIPNAAVKHKVDMRTIYRYLQKLPDSEGLKNKICNVQKPESSKKTMAETQVEKLLDSIKQKASFQCETPCKRTRELEVDKLVKQEYIEDVNIEEQSTLEFRNVCDNEAFILPNNIDTLTLAANVKEELVEVNDGVQENESLMETMIETSSLEKRVEEMQQTSSKNTTKKLNIGSKAINKKSSTKILNTTKLYAIKLAIQDVIKNNLSIRKSAIKHGISVMTLWRCFKNNKSIKLPNNADTLEEENAEKLFKVHNDDDVQIAVENIEEEASLMETMIDTSSHDEDMQIKKRNEGSKAVKESSFSSKTVSQKYTQIRNTSPEYTIHLAIEDVLQNGLSIRKSAIKHGICVMTLWRRLKNNVTIELPKNTHTLTLAEKLKEGNAKKVFEVDNKDDEQITVENIEEHASLMETMIDTSLLEKHGEDMLLKKHNEDKSSSTKKRSQKSPTNTQHESTIKLAIQDVIENGLTIRKSAIKHGICVMTLWRRFQKNETIKSAVHDVKVRGLSITTAALVHNVEESTLDRHLKYKKTVRSKRTKKSLTSFHTVFI